MHNARQELFFIGSLFIGAMMIGIPLKSQSGDSGVLLERVETLWGIGPGGRGAHGCNIKDFDLDKDEDVFISSYWTSFGRKLPSQLFVQEPQNHFQDKASQYGISLTNIHVHDSGWLDVNHDGRPDLYVASTIGPHQLFVQNKDGGFQEAASVYGFRLHDRSGARAVGIGDVNGDRNPDVFVVNNPFSDDPHNPVPNYLFIQGPDGIYHNEAEERGVADPRELQPGLAGVGQGATMVDYDQDGDEDIFSCIINMQPRLFENDGTGHFTEVAQARGIVLEQGCYGATFGDMDNDGDLDLVTSSASLGSVIHLFYQERGAFQDLTSQFNLPGYAFSPLLSDVNLDGRLDIIIARQDRKLSIYLNGVDQFTLVNPLGNNINIDARGGCVGDLDNDGDDDLIIVHKLGDHVAYRNNSTNYRYVIGLRSFTRFGPLYGTQIYLEAIDHSWRHYAEISSGFGYMSHRTDDVYIIGAPNNIPALVTVRLPWGTTLQGLTVPIQPARKGQEIRSFSTNQPF